MVLFNKTLSIFSQASTSVIINTMKSTSTSILSIINIMRKSNINFKEYDDVLIETDIEFIVTILDSLIEDYNAKDQCRTIKMALISLHEILVQIHNDLIIINDAIHTHKLKYFNYFRTFKCDCDLDKLRINNSILNNRYKMLFDLLKLYSNTN